MTWLNGADRSQDFSKKYPGAAIKADKCVIHTTEGASWPSYDGGANAPHLTVLVDKATGAMRWRQHFPLDRSSRALKNLPGGVETNTDDTIQIELIGTCDPRAVTGWAKNSVLWPAAEEKHLSGVRAVLQAIVAAVPTIPWQDAAPRGWKAYPGSYANGAGQRLTFEEWRNARGFLGHQHVPENTHGDPGAIPIGALLAGADDVMQNTEEQFEIFKTFMWRFLKWHSRPDGPEADWTKGPTIFEQLAQIAASAQMAATNADGTPAQIDVEALAVQLAAALPKEQTEKLLDSLAARLKD